MSEIIAMCSSCRWLGYCVERIDAERRLQLICAECRAGEGWIATPAPMLPIAPLPRPKPPARETAARGRKVGAK